MTYAKYGKVEAVDFNSLVGAVNGSTPMTLNYLWGTGNGNAGYGQEALGRVAANTPVTAQNWKDLLSIMDTISSHQNTVVTQPTSPNPDDTVTYLKPAADNLGYLYLGRNSAYQQGISYSRTVTNANATWYDSLTYTHTATFESPDAARYFFNCGGQLKLNFSHPAGDRVNALFNKMCIDCGTVVMSAMSDTTIPSTAKIGQYTFEGVTKIGGTGLPNTRKMGAGYYGLGTNDTVIFSQSVIGTPAKYYTYVGSNITIKARTNGQQGGNGDNGTVITFTTTWDQVPNGVPVTPLSATTLVVSPPSETYLTKSWGAVTLDGTVTGS